MNSTIDSTRTLQASAAAGFAAAVLILGGTLLSSRGMPSPGSDAAAWSRWAEGEERVIEIGSYYLLVPGLLFFLVLLAAVVHMHSSSRIATLLASWSGVIFVVFMMTSAVVASTSASTFGFFDDFDDPEALTVFTGASAGFHLTVVAAWSLALAMAATAVGLRAQGLISARTRTATFVLAVLAVATGELGAGLMPALLWMVLLSVMLLRRAGTPVRTE
jgi:hypothetical protein